MLIFDSGVGGLSVFKEIQARSPQLDCYYLFDNLYFPYGELENIQLITRLTHLLDCFINDHPVDLVVIACNSASTVALKSLRAHFSIPIVGVVPAIKPASAMTHNNVIGLLATPATINRIYTQDLIAEFAADKQVLKIGSTELVKLAEEKLLGLGVDNKRLKAVLKPWCEATVAPDTLVLGCTHFPLIKAEIAACFKTPVQLIDSGKAISTRVGELLGPLDNQNTEIVLKAFYTQAFFDDEHFNSLKCSFENYGFRAMQFFVC